MEDAHSPSLAAVPPLAWMAGVAALADLLLNRILIPFGGDLWSRDTLARFDSSGAFAGNLSVVSALVAL
ncbi:MAG: hypothetical protein JRJ80_13360, partial [Deltaproteobacteria bacterium]|nr:hypothetical protein [Deltaproteobacteria bacterium]